MAIILIVDDEPEIRNVLCLALESAGFAVRLASTGEEALGWVRTHAPDVIVCDIHLPGMSGVETIRAVLAIAPSVKVIVTSGDGEAEWEISQIPGMRDDFVLLTKPFRLSRLVDAVHREMHEVAS